MATLPPRLTPRPSARLPSFATPTSLDLRVLQQIINNIREGLQTLDARLTQVASQAGQSTLTQGQDGAELANVRQQLAALRLQLAGLLDAPPASTPLASLVMIPGEDGEPGEDGVPGMAGQDASEGAGLEPRQIALYTALRAF